MTCVTPSSRPARHHHHSSLTIIENTKAAKSVAVIIVLFVVSWLPLYTINTVLCFCPACNAPPELIRFAIVLSHFNSAWNPAVYAWAIKDFRDSLRLVIAKL